MVAMDSSHLIFALIAGLLPALVWLWYWTREDKLHPEPRKLLLLAFIAGGLVVAFTIPLQKLVREWYGIPISNEILFWWALIEESLKLCAALIAVLWRTAVDEPIDDMIYMITVALGFSAVENALFLLTPLMEGNIVETVIAGNFRFFGASLLHLLSSSLVGVALALSFYKSARTRLTYALWGVVAATIVHTTFNVLILKSSDAEVLKVFAFVWVGIVALLLFFEKVKRQQIMTQFINKK